MTLYLENPNDVGFGVQASNVSEVAQLSSTTTDVFQRFFTNNDGTEVDNLLTGSVIGSSNWDGAKYGRNQFYMGHLSGYSNIQKVFVMQQDRVGINTSVPVAPLHVYGSNIGSWSSLVRVETSTSNAVPAFVVNKDGYVGIGTDAVPGTAATIKGTLSVDNIVATNFSQIFKNIANRAYINNAIVTVPEVKLNGSVNFNVNFNGTTNTVFNYTLSANSNNSTYYTVSRSFNNTVYDADDFFTSQGAGAYLFSSPGDYTVDLSVATTGGEGEGSSFSSNAITTFYVPPTDPVGPPAVSLASALTSTNFSGSTVTVSGIPYFGYNTTMTIPSSRLAFTNIYNSLDPRKYNSPYGCNVLQVNSASPLDYSQVFTDVSASSGTNNLSIAVSLTSSNVTSSNTAATLSVPATVFNINYPYSNVGTPGATNSALVTGIGYLSRSIGETSNVVTVDGVAVSQTIRMSISSSITSSAANTPNPSTDLTTFSSPTKYDSFYSPFSGEIYASASSVPRGTIYPSGYTAPTMDGSHFTFVIYPNVPLNQFVLYLPPVADGFNVSSVYVRWTSINQWFDATTYFASAGGCAMSSYEIDSNRFPIQMNLDYQPYLTCEPVYVNVRFTGHGPLSKIRIANA